MIADLKPNTVYAVHLRASSTSGGKDWVGSVTSGGEIHTYWGRTGQIGRHLVKSGNVHTLNKLISKKMRGKSRYYQVDEFVLQQGWRSQRNHRSQSGTQEPTPTIVELSSEAPTAAASIKWDF